MPRWIRLFQVDAFTTQRFSGNPAGVVLDAQRLSDTEMQLLARELGSDTAFVLPPDDAQHDLRMRFFTPRNEAAFVGHATLAAHSVLQAIEPRYLRRQQGQTGTVEVTALEADRGFAIRQKPPALGRLLAAQELGDVLALLGLDPAQLDPLCPPQIVGVGSTRLLLGVAGNALDVAQPRFEALGKLSAGLGAQGFFLFTRKPAVDGSHTEARMFCPAIGIDEDPVSGNAHAMLGTYLVQRGLLSNRAGVASFDGVQGRHVGRPGRVSVELQLADDGSVRSTRIAGQAVTVFQAVLEL